MATGGYGKVRHSFWTDPDIKRVLSPEQKTLLIYYFTSPHGNLAGLYYVPLEFVASETGLTIESVREWTLGALAPFVTYDERTEEVLVHRAVKHQVGEDLKSGDKRIKAIENAISEVHSPRLVEEFFAKNGNLPVRASAPSDAPSDAPSMVLPSPFEANSSSSSSNKSNNRTEQNIPPSGDTPAAYAPEVVDSKIEVMESKSEPTRQGKTQSRRSPLTDRPADWAPNEAHKVTAAAIGADLAYEADQFRNYHDARGTRFKDWDAAFRTWLGNVPKFGAARDGHRPQLDMGAAAYEETAHEIALRKFA